MHDVPAVPAFTSQRFRHMRAIVYRLSAFEVFLMRLVDVPVRVILSESTEPHRRSSQAELHQHSSQAEPRRPPSQSGPRRQPERPAPPPKPGATEQQTAASDPQPATSELRPTAFQWRGRTYHIARIVDQWRYVGRWWIGEGEWRFVKVETTDGGLFELYFDTAADEWRLYRIYD